MSTTHSLAKTEGIYFEELADFVKSGARFVTYQYTISLFAVTLKRLSAVYFIAPGMTATRFRKTANYLSLCFGWWGLPYGPIRTFESLSTNRKGGIDVTKDVMLNITKEDFSNNKVVITNIYSPFHTPNKYEMKYLRKSLRQFRQNHPAITEVYFALYVNVTNGAEPFFVIGLPGKYTETEYTEELLLLLYKSFRKHTRFEFVDINNKSELSEKLMEMGLKE